MTTPPGNSRIDKRTRLRSGRHEDAAVDCTQFLPDSDAGERVEKVKAQKSESAIIMQHHDTVVINEKCNEMLRESMVSILNTIVLEARAGNMQAAKFVVDRILPDPRDTRVKFDLREIKGVNDAIGAWHDVLAAMSQGKITLKEAQSVCGLLKGYIEANGLREFSKELAELKKFTQLS